MAPRSSYDFDFLETADYIRTFSKSEVFPITGDLSRKEDVRRMVDETVNKFKKIDILDQIC